MTSTAKIWRSCICYLQKRNFDNSTRRMMEFEKTSDPSNPLYFFQHTQQKWVNYDRRWFPPDEWAKYIESRPIDPEVEWYYDPLKLLKQWQDELLTTPTPYLLNRYFELASEAIRYYRNKAAVVPRKGMGVEIP